MTEEVKKKFLKKNTRSRLLIICQVLHKTVTFYKKTYYESDLYRLQKLFDLFQGIKLSKFEIDAIAEQRKVGCEVCIAFGCDS